MNDRFNSNKLSNLAAEGEAVNALKRNNLTSQNLGPVSNFFRIVVLDVISDPSIIDQNKLRYYEHDLRVSNIKYASVAPRNAIIGLRVMDGLASAAERPMVFYPFFPSHLAFPSKPGEHVWAMFEHPDAKINEIGWWFCRISEPHFVDDVNHTHSNRQFDQSFQPGIQDIFDNKVKPKYEFPNGAVEEKQDGTRYIPPSTSTIRGDEKAYEAILKNSEAAKLVQYEAVPRYKKRPGDVVLEGTNNSLIVLGTDRVGPAAAYSEDVNDPTEQKGKLPSPSLTDQVKDAGSIDIVVGRGQTSITLGSEVLNSLNNTELGKSKLEVIQAEGDPDFKNDRSRLQLSMKTRVDSNFQIDPIVKTHTIKNQIADSTMGSGAAAIKSDKIRLIARQDIVILVTGAKDSDVDEKGRIKDPSIDPANAASITIRANGDIIFTPSKTGVIKLGGDDADKGIVCTDMPVAVKDGVVEGPTLITTMGGQIAGSKRVGDNSSAPTLVPGQGKYSAKVLIK